MQIPLTRIEYDYVINTFYSSKPPLLLQFKHFSYPIEAGSYQTKNQKIYFKNTVRLPEEPIAVYFQHKQRDICFFSALRLNTEYYTLNIPHAAYKYNKKQKKAERALVRIHTPQQQITTAYEHKQYPLDKIAYRGSNIPCKEKNPGSTGLNKIPLFRRRIDEFQQEPPLFLNNPLHNEEYLLFIDNHYLICTCSHAHSELIEAVPAVQFSITFPIRTIYAMQKKISFSRIIPHTNSKLFCFSVLYQYEEDRRFLYERVHHRKYQPIPTKSHAAF